MSTIEKQQGTNDVCSEKFSKVLHELLVNLTCCEINHLVNSTQRKSNLNENEKKRRSKLLVLVNCNCRIPTHWSYRIFSRYTITCKCTRSLR